MAKPKMGWEARQKRWRKLYKGVPLRIKAVDLGGTNRDDTLVAANRWFEEQKVLIDAQDIHKRFHPQEAEYKAEHEEIKSAIQFLSKLKGADPEIVSVIEKLKDKSERNSRIAQNELTPPIGLRERNPLHIPDQEVLNEAQKIAFEEMFQEKFAEYELFKTDQDWLKSHGYYTLKHVKGKRNLAILSVEDFINDRVSDSPEEEQAEFDIDHLTKCFQVTHEFANHYGLLSTGINVEYFKDKLSSPPKNEKEIKNLAQEIVDFMNVFEIRFWLKRQFDTEGQIRQNVRKEVGAIGDFMRGEILQRMKEQGHNLPKTKKLDYYVDLYMEYWHRRLVGGKGTKGRARKVHDLLKRYLAWTNVARIDKVAEQEHIAAFYQHIWDCVYIVKERKDGKISEAYGRDILQAFYQFLKWLARNGYIETFPRCLTDNDDYTIKVSPKKVKTITIKEAHAILDAASPSLRLFIMLTLNCGLSQGEIGRLRIDEYDPVKGRINHKRIKTESHEKVPVVSYLLWPETKALLDESLQKQIDKFPKREKVFTDYLLLNERGKPLWQEKGDSPENYQKTDNITGQYKRLMEKLKKQGLENAPNYYKFRKLPPSLIFKDGPQFGTVYRLWLGHSGTGVAEKHYIAEEETVLDKCIKWLHEQIFDNPQSEDEAIDEIKEKMIDA